MIDSVIFDLDGTLWNSTGVTYMIWNRAFASKGLSFRMTYEQALHYMGMTMHTIRDELVENGFSADEAAEIVGIMTSASDYSCLADEGCCDSVMLYDGCIETLRTLSRRYKLFIVSNCGSGYIESFLKIFDISSLFTDHVCYGDNGLSKGDNIRLIIERNGLDSPIYVGDTAGDEAATRKAGIPFVYASYGLGKALVPDHTILKISDLIPVCAML